MQPGEAKNWWTRPCGGREVLVLALPLVISMGSTSLMYFVDRMFLLWYSTPAMAAAMPAAMVQFSMLCFPWGVALYVNTFVAQYQGAGQPRRIGLVVWQGVRLGWFTVPLFLCAVPLAPGIFALAGHDPEVACLEVLYFQVLCFGAGAVVISGALSSFFTGRGETRVVMIVDCFAALLNIGLDYLWIFGHGGFPCLGIEGAAWATVVSQWARVLIYWRLMMRPACRRKYALVEGRRFDWALTRRLLKYGGPNGLQMLVEVSAFTLFVMLVGWLGADAIAATTLAFNVNNVAWVPMLGMAIAVTTMVGQQLGRNRADMAARATWTAFWMTQAYLSVMAALYVLVPDLFLMGHASGLSAERFGQLRDTTVVLLRFVAAYSLFDALNLIFVSSIKGAGDTRFILIVTAVMSPLPVSAAWAGICYGGLGLIWCWIVITAWICALGVIYLARFLQGRWQRMRVIEVEAIRSDKAPAEEPTETLPAEAVQSGSFTDRS